MEFRHYVLDSRRLTCKKLRRCFRRAHLFSDNLDDEDEAMPEFEIADPWNLGDRYACSPAVKRGNRIFISGMIACDPATGARGEVPREIRCPHRNRRRHDRGKMMRPLQGCVSDAGGTEEHLFRVRGG